MPGQYLQQDCACVLNLKSDHTESSMYMYLYMYICICIVVYAVLCMTPSNTLLRLILGVLHTQ